MEGGVGEVCRAARGREKEWMCEVFPTGSPSPTRHPLPPLSVFLAPRRPSGKAGCQRMIPLVLPEVTTMVQKLLTRGFPRAYQDRLQETEPERDLVSQVGYCVLSAQE